MAANGRLPGRSLRKIRGGRLKRTEARFWNAMCHEAKNKGLVVPVPTGSKSSYRTFAQQLELWNLYRSGRGNLAAHPGTSNHGWGRAVDVATPQMRTTIDRVGSKYGIAKRWSDAPGEWWHLVVHPEQASRAGRRRARYPTWNRAQ